MLQHILTLTLREKCPYSEIFWSVFSRIRTEYGEIRSKSLHSVRTPENGDQENSEYEYFSRSVRRILLIHLMPLAPFNTTLKHHKTSDFPMFSAGIESDK